MKQVNCEIVKKNGASFFSFLSLSLYQLHSLFSLLYILSVSLVHSSIKRESLVSGWWDEFLILFLPLNLQPQKFAVVSGFCATVEVHLSTKNVSFAKWYFCAVVVDGRSVDVILHYKLHTLHNLAPPHFTISQARMVAHIIFKWAGKRDISWYPMLQIDIALHRQPPQMGTPKQRAARNRCHQHLAQKYFYNIFYGRWFDGILCGCEGFPLKPCHKTFLQNHQ